MDEELFRSKMADDFQEYKVGLRMQIIYQFHAEAAEIEIKLVQTLLADEGTKESRARAVQEHETSMMLLREKKEEERKKLCAEEREKRREQIKQHVALLRHTQNKAVDPRTKANPSKPWPETAASQQRAAGHTTHQKENVPLTQPTASSSKLELPGILKKSISALSQDEASANESVFANAMAMMSQGKVGAAAFTSYPPSSNEAIFANAATTLFAPPKPGSNGLNVPQPPSIMKKTNSSRSHEPDIPHITVGLAEPPAPVAVPTTTAKGKKGKKGQPAVQQSVKPPTVTVTEEPDIDAEPPPAPSFWGAAPVTAKSTWETASASVPASKYSASVAEDDDAAPTMAQAPSWGSFPAKKAIPVSKKGKAVTISEEPDVEADPIVSPPSSSGTKTTKGGWGAVNNKSKFAPTIVEESEPTPVTSAGGKKTTKTQTPAKSTTKQSAQAAFVSEEQESEVEPVPAPSKRGTKTAWAAPTATPSVSTAGKQKGKKGTQQQAEPRRGPETSVSKSVRVETVPDPDDDWAEIAASDSNMPGTLEFDGEDQEEEGVASAWFNQENINYWANLIGSQAEPQAQEVPESPEGPEKVGKHVRWTPAVDEDSDEEEEFGGVDEDLDNPVWLQYAIGGSDIPLPESAPAPAEPRVTPADNAQRGPNLWEQGKGKKKSNQSNGDIGNRAQETPVSDRAAFPGGQWPKMESWLSSAPRVGQSSGSARFF
jgi:hypothetical protein